MPISLTDYYKIDKKLFDKFGALDIILDKDSLFFIDPLLVRNNKIKEFSNAEDKINSRFSEIITIIKHYIENKNHIFFKEANELLTFKEITGSCLGYSKLTTKGNAIGSNIREKILYTLIDLINAGETDPIIFDLVGLFQGGVGCDRISDLITFILEDNILEYSHNVFSNFPKIKKEQIKDGKYLLPINKFNNKPILLIPKQILKPLPIALDFYDIDTVCQENDRVRSTINNIVSKTLNNRKRMTKEEIREFFLNSKEFRKILKDSYKKASNKTYDFSSDPYGEIIWYDITKKYIDKFPLDLSIFKINDQYKNIKSIVKEICKHFKSLIEEKGLWRLLYNDDSKPKREAAAQLTFFGTASKICEQNDIDLSREVNNGRGPVDFKLSKGQKEKVIVEIKLSTNRDLIHGFTKQLPTYMKQEETKNAIFLILSVSSKKKDIERVNKLLNIYNEQSNEIKDQREIIIIDANPKESATKIK